MEANKFDEEAFFGAVATCRARAILIGRRALVALGIPVGTLDYDFWVHIDDAALFNRPIEAMGFVASRTPDEARQTGRYVLEGGERIDVLVARSMPMVTGGRLSFDEVWERRQLLAYTPGVTVAIPQLDDLISTKRFAARAKDLADVELLLALKAKQS